MLYADSGSAPVKDKTYLGQPVTRKGGPTKNLQTNSEKTVRCRGKGVWSERVNWYSQQILILPRETE
jgi:hypothetical protein